MRPQFVSLLLLTALLPTASHAAGPPENQPTARSARAGLDLARLKELDSPKLSPAQRLQLGLRLYRDEMVHPTPRPGAPYTDFRTHDYVLAQLTRKLAEVELDAAALRQSWERMNPGEVKDSLTLLLLLRSLGKHGPKEPASTGNGGAPPRLKDQVASYLLERKHPLRLRELAAYALGQAAVQENDASLGPLLARVIREDSQGQYKLSTEKATTGKRVLVYPVRRAAAAAIREMEQQGLLLESFVVQAAKSALAEVAVPERAKR